MLSEVETNAADRANENGNEMDGSEERIKEFEDWTAESATMSAFVEQKKMRRALFGSCGIGISFCLLEATECESCCRSASVRLAESKPSR